MAQFDVHRDPSRASSAVTPFLVMLQSDAAASRRTLIVAPVARAADPAVNAELQLAVEIEGERLVVLFQAMAAVDRALLGPPAASLGALRDRIANAIDRLFLGS